LSVRIEITTKGMDRLGNVLKKMPDKVREQAQDKLLTYAHKVKNVAYMMVPVKTGSLQKSIRVEVYSLPAGYLVKLGIRAGGYVVNPESRRIVDYAGYVEYGTRKMKAQPFMRPAIEFYKPELSKVLRQIVKEAVNQA